MRTPRAAAVVLCWIALLPAAAMSADNSSPQSATQPKSDTYHLRYKFKPNETVRWEVEQQAQIRTTVAGTTQTAETNTVSTKAWKVTAVDAKGVAIFQHSVENVDMRQKLTGRQEVRYNSRTDKVAPEGFQDAAKSVGVTLTVITLDPAGKVLLREEKRPSGASPSSQITIPLPAEAVPVGHIWLHPYEMSANAKDGTIKKVKLQQRLTLLEVKNGVATIKLETQVLTPIHDPQIEAQLVQGETNGTVRFDVDAGRLLGMQADLDRHVVGFQGESSSLHYLMRVTEKLLPAGATASTRSTPVAGPVAAPKAPAPASPVSPKPAPAVAEKPTSVLQKSVPAKPAPAIAETPAPTLIPAKPAPAIAEKPATAAKPAAPATPAAKAPSSPAAKPGSRPSFKRR